MLGERSDLLALRSASGLNAVLVMVQIVKNMQKVVLEMLQQRNKKGNAHALGVPSRLVQTVPKDTMDRTSHRLWTNSNLLHIDDCYIYRLIE